MAIAFRGMDARLPTTAVIERGRELGRELDAVDRSTYATIRAAQTPRLDSTMARLSNAANYSRLWLGCAAVVGVLAGRRGRRAAILGLASVGVSSAVSNAVLKPLLARSRPRRAIGPRDRMVRMPSSGSLPSGHSASAFAFATAVGSELPTLSLPLRIAAATVAYSRVHTGVHYPADAVLGSLVGASTAQIVGYLAARRWPRST